MCRSNPFFVDPLESTMGIQRNADKSRCSRNMLHVIVLLSLSKTIAGFYCPYFPQRQRETSCMLRVSSDATDVEVSGTRRSLFGYMFASVPATFAISASAEETIKNEEGLVSTNRLAGLLRSVPTFTIVDQKGVPFMVVGEDAKVTGYFFTEYDEADRILKLARESAEKAIAEGKNDPEQRELLKDVVNPWKSARISTVPMDFAVTLVTKSLFSTSKFGGGAYFQIAPSVADIEDALTITGKEDLAEGKVPLFYYADFKINQADGSVVSPLYFQKSQLEAAYRQQEKVSDDDLPPIKVTEFFGVLTEMVKPGGTDAELQTLVFVAPTNSALKAKECVRKSGKEPPFVVGERNIVL